MPLRPLWITENYPPDRGGMAQSCDRIVQTLRDRGVVVDVAHVSRRYGEWRTETKAGGAQICCPADEDPAHTLNRLWNIVSRRDAPTHVVAFGGTLPLLAAPAFAAWLSRPLITLLRGNDFDAAIFSPKKSDILRAALAASAAVCTVTRDHMARIAALIHPSSALRAPSPRERGEGLLGVDPRPAQRGEGGRRPGEGLLRWIPDGVDVTSWQLMPHDREAGLRWRSENVEPGRRVLGIFGQLKRKKGVQWFLQALERSGYASRFHVLLVGDVEELQLESVKSTVLPFRDRFDLLPLFAACDAVVVPSFYDGLPNVVLEAAALGIPLLTSNAGGMADILTNGSNAIVFEAGDEHDCRRAIFEAATSGDDALAALGRAAKQMVVEQFSAEREAQQYVDVLFDTAPQVRRLEVAYEKP